MPSEILILLIIAAAGIVGSIALMICNAVLGRRGAAQAAEEYEEPEDIDRAGISADAEGESARQVKFTPLDSEPETVSAQEAGDESLTEALERAVLNLLHNAVRFARSRVSLSVCCREGMLVFAVRDDGPGFSAQALERAGRGMYTEEAQCGSHLGLGLCTAARTARRSGGTLLLQNDAGACACLTVKAQIVRGK